MIFLGIIPARYASTRLEGKPLLEICGKPMIQHVYERALKVLADVFVATDDSRIYDVVNSFGGNAVMTSPKHITGTDRCLEAYKTIQSKAEKIFNAIINIQGDEPLLHPEQLTSLIKCFDKPNTEMATLITKVKLEEDLKSGNEAFVTFDKNMNALYFSRNVIPGIKGNANGFSLEQTTYYKQIGIYAYTPEALELFPTLPQTNLEIVEGLEQNRWIEHGRSIRINITEYESMGIDTPEDLEKIRKICSEIEE